MVRKARKWVKETVLGVAGTILTATVLGMLGFSSGTPGSGNAPVINTSTNPVQNQLQNQLAGVLQGFAQKASQTASAMAQEHLKKRAEEQGLTAGNENTYGYGGADQVQATSFSARREQTLPQYVSDSGVTSDSSSGRYGTAPSGSSSSERYGVSNADSYVQTTDSGSSSGGFKSNTAATVAANAQATQQQGSSPMPNAINPNIGSNSNSTIGANPAPRQDPRVQTVSENQPAAAPANQTKVSIEGLWEQLVYNPDDKKWYSGGIYRVTKEQDSFRLAFLDTSQIKPVFVSIAGIKNLRHMDGVWSFESHLDVGEVLEFKLQKKDDNTFQGYCYQDGVQLSVNAWRRVDPEMLK